MIDFLKMTAWKMEKPKPYGMFHLVFFFAGFALALLLAYLLRKANDKQNRAILLTVGGFLVLSEVYKQLFYTFVIGEGKYQWWIFPFQMCSVPMYFCLIVPFLKDGKIRRGMYNFMLAFNLMGGFISFAEPSGLCHEYWTLTLHAFIWHMLLVFVGLYIGFSGRAGTKLGDYKYSAVTFCVLCAMAFAFNLIFWNMPAANNNPTGHMNMFFVGPATTSLAVFKDISAKYGWYVNAPIYIGCMCLASFLFFLPFTVYNKRKNAGR